MGPLAVDRLLVWAPWLIWLGGSLVVVEGKIAHPYGQCTYKKPIWIYNVYIQSSNCSHQSMPLCD